MNSEEVKQRIKDIEEEMAKDKEKFEQKKLQYEQQVAIIEKKIHDLNDFLTH